MIRFVLKVCAFLLAFATAAPSLAADMPGSYGEPAYGPAYFSWYGFYLGLNGGYGWGTSNWSGSALTGTVNPAGPMFGGTATSRRAGLPPRARASVMLSTARFSTSLQAARLATSRYRPTA